MAARTAKQPRAPEVSLLARLLLLPLPERCFAVLLLVCSALPPIFILVADVFDPQGTTVIGAAGRHPVALCLLSAFVVLGALIALEPPRALALVAYLRQLRARLHQVQSNYDAELRRLLQEKHHVPADSIQPRP